MHFELRTYSSYPQTLSRIDSWRAHYQTATLISVAQEETEAKYFCVALVSVSLYAG